MTSFQRAHSPEQREVRRRMILDTAAAMLAEMPVAEVTLNELSRRVRLAKSNVLRYFESREAVLMELANSASLAWLAELDDQFATAIDPASPAAVRGDRLVATFVTSLADRPVLCDLISNQASVLERNISTDAVARYKHESIAAVTALAALVQRHLPELSENGALEFTAIAIMMTGAVWTHSHPAAAVLAAYDADPSLAGYRLDFVPALRRTLDVLLTGLLAG